VACGGYQTKRATMTTMARVGKADNGRPRFSRADVIRAGVEITRERGLSKLSLSAVAERLGVQRPSLYHHLPGGLRELRSGVIESIANVLPPDGAAAEPEATLAEWEERALRRMAEASREFPGVIQYLITNGRNEQLALDETDRLARLMRELDLETSTASAFVIMHAYLTGWICALRPDAEAADAAGMTALADVLRESDKLDREQILMDGFRALLAGLSRSPAVGRAKPAQG
jgi:AcrR family transcriptional regulator